MFMYVVFSSFFSWFFSWETFEKVSHTLQNFHGMGFGYVWNGNANTVLPSVDRLVKVLLNLMGHDIQFRRGAACRLPSVVRK